MLLAAPVPDPGPTGPYGTMPWLRATVSRFANGETHARRRALVEAMLAGPDPAGRRDEAAAPARAASPPAATASPATTASPASSPATTASPLAGPQPPGGVATPYLPVAVLARRLGVRDL